MDTGLPDMPIELSFSARYDSSDNLDQLFESLQPYARRVKLFGMRRKWWRTPILFVAKCIDWIFRSELRDWLVERWTELIFEGLMDVNDMSWEVDDDGVMVGMEMEGLGWTMAK